MDASQQKVVLIHYGEIALKGKNRSFFEKRLARNIKTVLASVGSAKVERLYGRFIVSFSPPVPEDRVVRKRLERVFGIANFSFAVSVPQDLTAIKAAAWDCLKDETFDSFKISASRAEKHFPLNSVEINREVGAHVQQHCNKRVDLNNPDCTCFIELVANRALVYCEKIRGLRGLPVGVSERAVSLLSSGIDSPVASYLMLKRGVDLVYVHFHSQPFTDQASQENAARLVQVLSRYQYRAKIFFVPFIEIQKQIMTSAPAELRVLLYRRYMLRLAERIAVAEKARALVTGDSVGQVASQTLSNLRAVSEAAHLPILRPLAGYDKEEIVEKAREIGTFEISIAPYDDCCSLFVPRNAETRAHPRAIHAAERRLELDELMKQALERAEVRIIEMELEEA